MKNSRKKVYNFSYLVEGVAVPNLLIPLLYKYSISGEVVK